MRRARLPYSLPLPALLAAFALAGCTTSTEPTDDLQPRTEHGDEPGEAGKSKDSLPFIDGSELVDTYLQLLPEPTAHGENVAVHIALPAPRNPELQDSLIRIFGTPDAPLVLFRSDALVDLGRIEQSPGEGFFTTFASLDSEELEQRLQTEERFANAEVPSETRLRFAGRTPIALTTGLSFNLSSFTGGGLVALGPCPVMPTSTLARWEESLMIIDPQIVQDFDRTHDECMPVGNQGDPDGVWTFKHLMEEMAIGSGLSTHDFVVAWLETWMNEQVINGDVVDARLTPSVAASIMTEVVEPWAAASGVPANLIANGNLLEFDFGGGQLDLDKSPFRLSAIVNRLDLGRTADGGYGGSTSDPLDAGELRFVFGVQNLTQCPDPARFSVIFEYGVPIEGCDAVRDWANQWTALNDPSVLPRFSGPWINHLESLTESVVRHGSAPGRGNDNAINQIRTNEFNIGAAIGEPWELREFTLSTEDLLDTTTRPPSAPDSPASGALRVHTVAMTPDDGVFHPSGATAPHPTIDAFVNGPVLSSVVGNGTPGDCATSYVVPADFPNGDDFRGGNSFTDPPPFWGATIGPSDQETCARHEFSLNTCNGCHFADTATGFFHVDPTQMPAILSEFLTGGFNGIHTVPDTQVSGVSWDFADLDRRFNRLYDVACTECLDTFSLVPSAFGSLAEIAGVVPLDVPDGSGLEFEIGPVVDLAAVDEFLNMRADLVDPDHAIDADASELVRPIQTFVH